MIASVLLEERDAFGFESLTVGASAVGFSSANDARAALVTVEDASIRFRIDGTDPTSEVGHLLNPGDSIILRNVNNIRRFRAIRAGTADATLRVTYFR